MPAGHAAHVADELAPTADDSVPLAQLVGLVILVEPQYAPAGHGVDAFKPSAPQYAPAAQSKQLPLLTAPVDGR